MYPNKEQKTSLLNDLIGCLPLMACDADWASTYRRLHVRPHHGETPAEFLRYRRYQHPCMTYTDLRPMDIITKGPHDAGHTHSYTMAVPVLLKADAPALGGIKKSRRTAATGSEETKQKAVPVVAQPPVPTDQIPQHLHDDWTPLGRMVSSEQGKPEDVLSNITRYWLLPPAQGCTKSDLLRWPFAPSCSDFIHAHNWFGGRMSEKQENAHKRVVNAIVTSGWLQCWAVMMGRFLHCESAQARQTWPILFRLRELHCTLYKESVEWVCEGRPSGRYSQKVADHFSVMRLPAAQQVATPADVQRHVTEWTTFMTQYSMADCMFAWCMMNLNTEDTLKACASMTYKRHQWCLTRHLTPHALVRVGEKPTDKKYRVIQNTLFPLVRFPSSRAPQSVMVLSHAVIRPGLPVFSSHIMSLEDMRAVPLPYLRDQYGHAVFISALHCVMSLAACMTVEEREKQLFKDVLQVGNGGLFDSILEHCSTAIPTPLQPSSALLLSASAPVESSDDANRNARAQMRVAGLSTPFTGPRNEGRVVHIETEPAQKQAPRASPDSDSTAAMEDKENEEDDSKNENKGPGFQWMSHVGDGRPLVIHTRKPFLSGIGRALDCLVDSPADFEWKRNSQAFQAPDASVDLAQFLLYAEQSFQDPFVLTRITRLWRTSGLEQWLKSPLRGLGRAYFQLLLRHASSILAEYDVWLVLLWWFMENSPDKPALSLATLARFWQTFSRSYYQYMTLLCASCVRWLHAGLSHIHDRKARQTAFSHWLRIEEYVTQHRLEAWHSPEDPHSVRLMELLKTLCRDHLHVWSQITFKESKGQLAWPKLQWLLFFFLVHVVQPAPLLPTYFSDTTPPDTLQRIRSLYAVVHSIKPQKPYEVLQELHKAVCYTLTMGTKMFSPEVQLHWNRYAALTGALDGVYTVRSAVNRFVSTLLTSTQGHTGIVRLIQQYLHLHTAVIFVRVNLPQPFSLDLDLDAADDDMDLENSLMKALETTVVIYVVAESDEERFACHRLYEQLFHHDDVIDVVPAEGAVAPRPPVPEKPDKHVWKVGYADWLHSPRVFRPLPATKM